MVWRCFNFDDHSSELVFSWWRRVCWGENCLSLTLFMVVC